jgi:hypothetical protein
MYEHRTVASELLPLPVEQPAGLSMAYVIQSLTSISNTGFFQYCRKKYIYEISGTTDALASHRCCLLINCS